jgi:ferric-dicitrate binding protein FerR (iron transport regulator)
MNALTCREVAAEIDLDAAGECDPALHAAIQRHLASCPDCARLHQEAQQLLGLLDLQFQEPDRLRRLHARLDTEGSSRPPRPWLLRFPRQAAALAALLLLMIGLNLTGRPGPVAVVPPEPQPQRDVMPAPQEAMAMKAARSIPEAVAALPPGKEVQPARGIRVWTTRSTQGTFFGRNIDLAAGELWVRLERGGGEQPERPFEVRTAAGVVMAAEGEFFVGLRPAAKTVYVKVSSGSVRLSSPLGSVEGQSGAVLWVQEHQPPAHTQ